MARADADVSQKRHPRKLKPGGREESNELPWVPIRRMREERASRSDATARTKNSGVGERIKINSRRDGDATFFWFFFFF